MIFRPGQKVICVRDGWNIRPTHLQDASPALPREGVEYVVRSVAFDAFHGEVIRLHWLMLPPPHPNGHEPAFGVTGLDGIPNFKPVIETDISILTRLLAPTPSKELERVR
jgi:hypothetical protein